MMDARTRAADEARRKGSMASAERASRRGFLTRVGLLLGGASVLPALAACQATPAAPTAEPKVVEKTVERVVTQVVEKVVEKPVEKVVEKPVPVEVTRIVQAP